jgi:mRNA-degrading endonuclease RelE of RelBE toxin-antitoxin system
MSVVTRIEAESPEREALHRALVRALAQLDDEDASRALDELRTLLDQVLPPREAKVKKPRKTVCTQRARPWPTVRF